MKLPALKITPRAAALLVILLFAADRAPSVNFLLPEFCVEDERRIEEPAAQMLKNLSLDPQSHKYPGLIYNLTASVYLGAYLAANVKALPHYDSFASFKWDLRRFHLDFESAILLGRIMVIGLGVIALLCFHQFVFREFGETTALIALLFLATAPAFLFSAQLLKADVLLLAAVILSVIAGLRLLDKGRTRDYIIAGAALGLCMAAKYHIAAAVPLLVAHRFRYPDEKWLASFRRRRWLIIPAAALAVFFALSPFTFIHLSTALREAWLELLIQNRFDPLFRRSNSEWTHLPLLFIFTAALPFALGFPLYFASIAGAALKIAPPSPRAAVIWSYPLAFIAFMAAFSELGAPHLYLPAAPFAAIAAAEGFGHLFKGKTKIYRISGAALVILIAVYNLILFHDLTRYEDFVLRAGAAEMENTHQSGQLDLGFVPYYPNPDRPTTILYRPVFALSEESLAALNPGRIFVHHAFFHAYLDNKDLAEQPPVAGLVHTYLRLRQGDLGYRETMRFIEDPSNGPAVFTGSWYRGIMPDLDGLHSSIYRKNDFRTGR